MVAKDFQGFLHAWNLFVILFWGNGTLQKVQIPIKIRSKLGSRYLQQLCIYQLIQAVTFLSPMGEGGPLKSHVGTSSTSGNVWLFVPRVSSTWRIIPNGLWRLWLINEVIRSPRIQVLGAHPPSRPW